MSMRTCVANLLRSGKMTITELWSVLVDRQDRTFSMANGELADCLIGLVADGLVVRFPSDGRRLDDGTLYTWKG